MLKTLNMLSGPIGGMLEKACLAIVMYMAGKGYLPANEVAGIAAALYMVVSSAFTGAINSQTAKVQAINEADNGIKVVPANAPGPTVDAPLK